MASFCTKCGASLAGPFCVKCGTEACQEVNAVPLHPAEATVAPAPSPFVVATPQAAGRKMSPLAKLGIAAVIVVFVGAAVAVGGTYYVAHRVSQKFHEETGRLMGSPTRGENPQDVCGLLSKEDVSRAIGVEIVHTQREESGCDYLAKGDQAEMTARHATAMAAAAGADKKSQEMVQTFANGVFKTFQDERKERPAGPPGEVPVLAFSIDQASAETQMRLNQSVLGMLGPAGAVRLSGVGDEAFVAADGMLMVRKGNRLIRIIYITCPCSTDAVKPLAKEIAAAL